MRRHLSTAVVLATVLLGLAVPTVSAECMNWPVRATERPHIAFAFTATVVDVVRGDANPDHPGSGELRFNVTVDAQRVYRGSIPDSLTLIGTNYGCGFLYTAALTEGDRLFIASEQLEANPDETRLGNVMVWKRTGNRWVFHEDALRDGSDREFYPRAARTAATTADIVRLITAPPMTDTPTLPTPDERRGEAVLLGLSLVFLATFAVLLRRISRVGAT